LTLALVVTALVGAFHVGDVIHSPPHSFEVCQSVARAYQLDSSAGCYSVVSLKNRLSVVCAPATFSFNASASA
jgi:hypothetical protein